MKNDFTIEDLIKNFCQYLKLKGKSPDTISAYKKDINKILEETEFTQNNRMQKPDDFILLVSMIGMRIDTINEWDRFDGRKSSHYTKNRRKTSANRFNKFLQEKEYIEKIVHYKIKRAEDGPLAIVTEQQYKQIMGLIPDNKLYGARDRAIISLAYRSGLTSSEIASITYPDFINTTGMLWKLSGTRRLDVNKAITRLQVTNARDKKRELEIEAESKQELGNYEKIFLRLRGEEILTDPNRAYFRLRLFLRSEDEETQLKGKKLSSRRVRSRFGEYAKKASLKVKFSSLRNAYAQRLLIDVDNLDEFAYKMGISLMHAHALKNRLRQTNELNPPAFQHHSS